MSKNITSLRSHLFETLNRLAEATEENIDLEVSKSLNIVNVAEAIIKTAEVENQFLLITQGTGSGFIPLIQNENNGVKGITYAKEETEAPDTELIESPSKTDINFTELTGSRVKIFNGGEDVYWGEGEVVDFMDFKLFLINVVFWNNKRKSDADIHSKYITRIEVVKEND